MGGAWGAPKKGPDRRDGPARVSGNFTSRIGSFGIMLACVMARLGNPSRKIPPPAEWAVFFDFDNTLTPFDVLDEIISRFSVSQEWRELEEAWKAGTLDTRSCLDGQIRGMQVTASDLESFLATVKLDPHFIPLVELLREQGVRPVILSDSFTYFINFVLANHGVSGIPVFANEVTVAGDRWIPSFPYHGKGCPKCAHCKRQHLVHNGKTNIFVGDGRSDICGAEAADIVFAKATLLEHFRRKQRPCHEFRELKTIYHQLEDWIYAEYGFDN